MVLSNQKGKLVPQGKTGNSVVVQRSYKLKIYPNKAKLDTARYTNMRFNQYMNMFLGRLFFGAINISTKGMGKTANQALYKSRNIIMAQKKSVKRTKMKTNVPFAKNQGSYANIEKSKDSTFDYWISISNLWTKNKLVVLPAKSHKILNKTLKEGWILSSICEFKFINEQPYAIVFVSKKAPKIKKRRKVLGCDVGIRHSIVTSEGYMGHGLSRVIRIQKRRYAERRRQCHKISNKGKTYVKQILNREAKILIRRSVIISANIAVESPKRLANLKSGRLQGWARSYFANRLHVLGKENGIKIMDVNPYQTSITCSKCGVVDKRSRRGRIFKCVGCGYIANADLNASKVIASIGRASLKSDGKKSDMD